MSLEFYGDVLLEKSCLRRCVLECFMLRWLVPRCPLVPLQTSDVHAVVYLSDGS